ncbi:MAG: peptidase M16 [Gemmatimonadetes bacterium]|nr:peptidase M16 [Gemmatimonadota bacterium]MDP7631395.1 insulinase family protein [Candidatus Latescibacterota bacterium]
MSAQDFELLETRELDELNSTGRIYRHATGARVVSIANPQDENKVFGITFRTPPTDSTGLPHILEHSVLCGSRKFPVKEPFVELLKGSLKTFLNAFTYPDKTCYPVASQSQQDFYNLVDVYLDAVFHPRLTPEVLKQEGWHYEVDEEGTLSYKGVVFNEMKGANSSPERVMAEHCQQVLFPETTYGVDSGGYPLAIPDLTWEQFESFHQDYYHPSNAWIWFYGDDPEDRRLEILDEYLSEFDTRSADSSVALQSRWSEPKTIEETYSVSEQDVDDDGGKCMVAVNWLLGEAADYETRLGLQILDYILIGTSASPLRKALIDSGLGEDLTGGGMETELREIFFSVGLKGVAQEDEKRVEALVIETLESLARDGIDQETIRASLNTVEFRLRENNTGSYPRGLILMLRSLSRWLYDEDPFVPLTFEKPLADVKALGESDTGYFEALIRDHLLGNSHRATVFLRPDAEHAAREEETERQRLAGVRAPLSESDVDQLKQDAEHLKSLQEAPDHPEDLAKIPRLQRQDLDPKIRRIPLDKTTVAGAPVWYHDLFTNGIAYLDIGFDLRTVPQDLLPYLSLFGRSLFEIGTETEDFVRLSQRIGSRTGGMWAHSMVTPQRTSREAVARFQVRGRAMVNHIPDLIDILRDVLLTVNLDNQDRFLQMVLEEKAGEEAGLIPGGHSVVGLRLRSQFDEAAWVTEQMEGVTYLFFLRELAERIESDWEGVLAQLRAVKDHIVQRSTLLVNATMPDTDRAQLEPHLARLIEALPAGDGKLATWTPAYRSVHEGLTLPAQVNYVGKGMNLYDAGYTLHGSVGVITRTLRNGYLWDRVRVQGGAYGAFCSFDHFSGLVSFGSYRDPNLADTLAVYDGAGDYLKGLELNDDELTKGIIGAIGELDAYQLPDAKGYTSMVRNLIGVDDDYRQKMRDEVLATTAKDFRVFGEAISALAGSGRVVVLGSKDGIEAANLEREEVLEVVPVL